MAILTDSNAPAADASADADTPNAGVELIIVSGLSGAGKTVALHTLEDVGYTCIDNLPLFLLSELGRGWHQLVSGETTPGTAIGVDARSQPEQLRQLPDMLAALTSQHIRPHILFLEASTATLMRRFNETRRKHPLTTATRSLEEALEYERELLEPLRQLAHLRLDTTHTHLHELRDLIRASLGTHRVPTVSLLLQSFGFKHGLPEAFDFVFDVRCLPNPHWQPHLRHLTGRDADVVQFLEQFPQVGQYRDDVLQFLRRWLPAFAHDGRSYVTLALGCTGGQHRSVYMVETLRCQLQQHGHNVLVRHRELV